MEKQTKYQELVDRKLAEFGEKFSADGLAAQFIPYYNNGVRIRVDFGDGLVKSGTVGATTGWKPTFLLMLTKRSTGSSWTLGADDKVTEIKVAKPKKAKKIQWNSYLATAYAEGFCEGEGASQEDQLSAWQYLIDTGLCWTLQGWFGRTAQYLIEQGLCQPKAA